MSTICLATNIGCVVLEAMDLFKIHVEKRAEHSILLANVCESKSHDVCQCALYSYTYTGKIRVHAAKVMGVLTELFGCRDRDRPVEPWMVVNPAARPSAATARWSCTRAALGWMSSAIVRDYDINSKI